MLSSNAAIDVTFRVDEVNLPKAAVLMKTLAAGAQLWHRRTMGPELDLKQASRETLLAVIAEQRGVIAEQQDTIAQMGKRVEGLEARLSGGGPEAGPRRRPPGARSRRNQERSRAKSVPTALPGPDGTHAAVVHAPESCPECHTTLRRGVGAADPRGQRDSGGPGGGHGARLPMARTCPLCRKRRLIRGASAGYRRGPAAAWGQSGQSDHHSAGSGAIDRSVHSTPLQPRTEPSVEY